MNGILNQIRSELSVIYKLSGLPLLPENVQVWREFEKFVHDGKVKQLGLSNCYDLNVLQGSVSENSIGLNHG